MRGEVSVVSRTCFDTPVVSIEQGKYVAVARRLLRPVHNNMMQGHTSSYVRTILRAQTSCWMLNFELQSRGRRMEVELNYNAELEIALLLALHYRQRRKRKRRNMWVHAMFSRSLQQGEYHNLLQGMSHHPPESKSNGFYLIPLKCLTETSGMLRYPLDVIHFMQ